MMLLYVTVMMYVPRDLILIVVQVNHVMELMFVTKTFVVYH